MVDDGDVRRFPHGAFQRAGLGQPAFDLFRAGFGIRDRALFFVEFVILIRQARHQGIKRHIEFGPIIGRAGDDQRRARFVDQDGVDFVDDGKMVFALGHLVQRVFHIVAQIVESELVVRAVGNVRRVGLAALLVGNAMNNDAGRHAKEAIDLAHPLGVALGEIVVDRDDVNALALKRVQVNRQRRDQCFALTRAHLGDIAGVQHHAAHQLNVEMAHAERASCAFADNRKGFFKQAVECGAIGEAFAEFVRLAA